jgi:hypothetical protein
MSLTKPFNKLVNQSNNIGRYTTYTPACLLLSQSETQHIYHNHLRNRFLLNMSWLITV